MRSLPVCVLLASGLTACAAAPATGARDGHLQPCPSAPHCVSSTATDEPHAIAPFQLVEPGPAAWDKVAAAVAATDRTTVVARDGHYLHAEVLSPWHIYTDDLELLLAADSRRIDVRSSSRIGYYDFKVNRKRVEALRAKLVELGLVGN